MSFQSLGSIAARAANTIEHIESPIEGILLNALIANDAVTLCASGDYSGEGIFLMPQYEFTPYRADFYIVAQGYHPGARVWPPRLRVEYLVEADGQEFHSTPEQVEHDRKRDAYFKQRGIRTIRLSGKMIYNQPEMCAENIVREIRHVMRGGMPSEF